MLDKLLLQIASDLCSFCHLGNFLGEIPDGRKGNNLFKAGCNQHWHHNNNNNNGGNNNHDNDKDNKE